jgi:metallo-beta-lactamase family protein
MSKPVLTCYGGAGTVTGANFMFEVEGKKFLIDCGLLQGVAGADNINASSFEYDVKEVEALFVTHAHADHIGRILRLVSAGFTGDIYSTPATRDIAEIMLHDLAHIEDLDYSLVDRAMALWKIIPYHERRGFIGFELEIFDSGHILGSGMLKFSFPSGKSIMFTGDLGNTPSPLLKPTDKVEGLTYLLMESVYGNRNHESPEVGMGSSRIWSCVLRQKVRPSLSPYSLSSARSSCFSNSISSMRRR